MVPGTGSDKDGRHTRLWDTWDYSNPRARLGIVRKNWEESSLKSISSKFFLWKRSNGSVVIQKLFLTLRQVLELACEKETPSPRIWSFRVHLLHTFLMCSNAQENRFWVWALFRYLQLERECRYRAAVATSSWKCVLPPKFVAVKAVIGASWMWGFDPLAPVRIWFVPKIFVNTIFKGAALRQNRPRSSFHFFFVLWQKPNLTTGLSGWGGPNQSW